MVVILMNRGGVLLQRGKLTFEVIETGIIPVVETRLEVNPNFSWIGVVFKGVGYRWTDGV
jgi:hypothetical protein